MGPFWVTLILVLFGAQARAYNAHINGLKSLQDRYRTTLTSLDKEILQAYSETTKLTPNDAISNVADQTLNAAKDRIDKLLDSKHEESLRLDLVDKLIFKISEKNPQDLKDALPKIIDDIVVAELSIGGRYTGGDRSLVPFLMNLATALRTRRESIENPLSFLENYLQYSSILNPKPVTSFRSEGGYLNESSAEKKELKKPTVEESEHLPMEDDEESVPTESDS
jgi:hypothetical protein